MGKTEHNPGVADFSMQEVILAWNHIAAPGRTKDGETAFRARLIAQAKRLFDINPGVVKWYPFATAEFKTHKREIRRLVVFGNAPDVVVAIQTDKEIRNTHNSRPYRAASKAAKAVTTSKPHAQPNVVKSAPGLTVAPVSGLAGLRLMTRADILAQAQAQADRAGQPFLSLAPLRSTQADTFDLSNLLSRNSENG